LITVKAGENNGDHHMLWH